MKHHLGMVICCLLPMALIFLLPLFGIRSGPLLFLFLILCFGLHLVMMAKGGHKHDGNGKDDQGGSHGEH